jgi:hypothetical protein
MLIVSCAAQESFQLADHEFDPVVDDPAYALGTGPVVLVDAAHGNYHTLETGYGAFGRLLERDGYEVRSAEIKVSEALLAEADILVISNALFGGPEEPWELPARSAFAKGEIETLAGWVVNGGSLLLIADHMPMPGATADLAAAFGIVFYNGFAMSAADQSSVFTLSRDEGTLLDHAITSGRNAAEHIDHVKLFTGQAFRALVPVEPLLIPPPDTEVLLPTTAWEFSPATARVSADGLYQGLVLRHGAGRVAVFGEAAMFTAQFASRDGVTRFMGMNDPEAADNQQFLLNVVHWLSGLLGA